MAPAVLEAVHRRAHGGPYKILVRHLGRISSALARAAGTQVSRSSGPGNEGRFDTPCRRFFEPQVRACQSAGFDKDAISPTVVGVCSRGS